MPETIVLHAGSRSDGTPVQEEVLVDRLGGNRYRILQSPAFVQGLASGDVFELRESDKFDVVVRGMNLCIQIFLEELDVDTLEREATQRIAELGGRLDGKAPKELVYTVPMAAGFAKVEDMLRNLVERFPQAEWYYGNVYDPRDGITPLNWWK